MKETRAIMGMPVTVHIVDPSASSTSINKVFDYLAHIDEKFSTYKKTSEITAINEGRTKEEGQSEEMRLILALCEETKKQTGGYFDARTPNGTIDPSGIVKGWAIRQSAEILKKDGYKNFYIEAGGDIQTHGKNEKGRPWAIGIKNPWNAEENVKIINVGEEGVATSGTYIRGKHIYNPMRRNEPADDIASITVIGPDVYEADRFATAAFAMGDKGINFIERLEGFEGYMIDKEQVATMTSGFEKYLQKQ